MSARLDEPETCFDRGAINAYVKCELPNGSIGKWRRCKSSAGKTYYYNEETGMSQWTLPIERKMKRSNSVKPMATATGKREEASNSKERRASEGVQFEHRVWSKSDEPTSSESKDDSLGASGEVSRKMKCTSARVSENSSLSRDETSPSTSSKEVEQCSSSSSTEAATSLSISTVVSESTVDSKCAPSEESTSSPAVPYIGGVQKSRASVVDRDPAEFDSLVEFLLQKKYTFNLEDGIELPEQVTAIINDGNNRLPYKLQPNREDRLKLEGARIDKQLSTLDAKFLEYTMQSDFLRMKAECSRMESAVLDLKSEIRKRRLLFPANI